MQVPLIGKVHRPMPWVIGLVTLALVGTTAVVVLGSRREATSEEQVAELTIPVETQPLTVRINASGIVQPIQTVNISPTTSDILQELLVEQGDRVTAGQIIARMKSDRIEAELARAQARITQAQANLAELLAGNRSEDIAQAQARVERIEAQIVEAQSRVELASDRVERNQMLYTDGAIARDDLDEVLNTAATTQASLEQQYASLREAQQNLALLQNGSRVENIARAEAEVDAAIAELQSVQVQLEDTFIRAPFAGIITQKFATEGAFVTPTTSASNASSATSSAIVALAEGLEILAEVPEVDIGQIELGQRVEVVADAYPDQVFEGEVKLIAPEAVVEQNVTFFQVRIELLTGLDVLRSQMNVDVEFIGDQLNNALVVPTVAIVTQDGETGVLVPDENNRIRFRPITSGTSVGNQTQILDGVDAGDRVFIDLPPGQSLENLNFGRSNDTN